MSITTAPRDERIDLGLSIEHETVTLSPRDWTAFLEGIDHADQPRPRLEAAARRYQKRRGLDIA